MAIFRENSDDSYVGIEFEAESDKAKKLNQFLQDELGVKKTAQAIFIIPYSNGDYVSDALAAQVGGIGIAQSANLSDKVALFEATHGTATKYAGKDYVNPGSKILSDDMMLRHMGWTAAADLIISSMEKSIKSKKVTYDFARLMEGATQVSCSGFGQVMIDHM